MIPSDYRLETVCARLVERLEGSRRSYQGRWADAVPVFHELAEEHVAAAMGEFEGLGLGINTSEHGEFLSQEVKQTFLPRYLGLAEGLTQREADGFGFGMFEPIFGRFALLLFGILGFIFMERLAFRFPYAWGLAFLSLALPAFPDLSRWSTRRRYRRQLGEILQDMHRVQEQSQIYSRLEPLDSTDSFQEKLEQARRHQNRSQDGRKNHSL